MKRKPAAPIPNKIEFETYRDLRGGYFQTSHTQCNPDCFNGIVSIRRFRVTVELIEEPRDVLVERLQKLWDETGNHHNWRPLENVAASLDYTFPNSPGSKRKEKQ